jgi:hypothetical protein
LNPYGLRKNHLEYKSTIGDSNNDDSGEINRHRIEGRCPYVLGLWLVVFPDFAYQGPGTGENEIGERLFHYESET